MNTKKLRPVPNFKSLKEEALFWDSHDLTDYFDFSKGKIVRFELIGEEKEESLTFRLQKNLKSKLEEIANGLGLSVSSLLRMWTIERLSRAY